MHCFRLATAERKVRKQLARGVGKLAKSLLARSSASIPMALRAQQGARVGPPTPFFGNQKSVRPLKMRAFFHSGEELREKVRSVTSFRRILTHREGHCIASVDPSLEGDNH